MTPVKSIADDPARSRRSFWAKTDDLTKADDQKNIFDPKQTILFSLFLHTKADDLSEKFKNKTRRFPTIL